MKVQLYIDPECRLSKVPYQVPNNTHYVTYQDYLDAQNQPDALTAYLYAAELAKDEIKRLKAEVERLKEENEELHKDYEALADEHTKLTNRKAEADRLKAEVERLRKAGDNLEYLLTSKIMSYEVGNASFEWRNAKGGKPSV